MTTTLTPVDEHEHQHEIEMGAEEALGHALPGVAAERQAALQRRVDYLTREVAALRGRAGHPIELADEIRRLNSDLAKARQLLADFTAQNEGRN